FMVDKAFWGSAVIAGILGATLSSALGSMLGAPRILQAVAEQKTIPLHNIFSKKTKKNEPRNALIFTGIIVIIALSAGSLNALASLITMFFLITYGMLNLVVFIQQSMKIISFRPTFKIPQIISFLGASQCIFIMFLIDPIFSVIAISIIVSLYVYLAKKGLKAEWGDVRGGMFLALAERAARIAIKFPRHQISWKPDLLLPVEDPKIWAGPLLFIKNICSPSGSVYAVTIKEKVDNEMDEDLKKLIAPLEDEGLLTSTAIIEDSNFLHGTGVVMQTLKNFAFRPNLLFLTIGGNTKKDKIINNLYKQAQKNQLGVMLLRQHPRVAFGMQRDVNLWLRDRSPNWHLAVLISLQLQLNWNGKINLITVASDENDIDYLYYFLEKLSDQARFPSMTEFHVLVGNFRDSLPEAPKADINIFGLSGTNIPFEFIREIPGLTNTSCLFVMDSGKENALV
ncbi:MAG: amino acid permease, partial [Calditrichia bacterium]|nr:amino acid permease [Calditrichia bacterium]